MRGDSQPREGMRDYVEASAEARRAARNSSGSLNLVCSQSAMMILGETPCAFHHLRGSDGFPSPVAYLAKNPVWLAEDIADFRDGHSVARGAGRAAARDPGHARAGTELGTNVKLLHRSLARGRATVPQSEGQVDDCHYWTREAVDKWRLSREAR